MPEEIDTRKQLSVVLSDERVAKLWRPGKGLESRVAHFYQTVLGEQLEDIPDGVSDDTPEFVRTLSSIKKLRHNELAWGDFKGMQGSQMNIVIGKAHKKKGTIVTVMSREIVKPELSKDKLYGFAIHEDRRLIVIYPMPTTKRFAAITFAGALNNMLAERSKRGMRDDVASFEGQIAMAEHMTSQQYLAKIGEIYAEEGIADIEQLRKAVAEKNLLPRLSKALEQLLFPNMPALSESETGARELLYNMSATWQLLKQQLGTEGGVAKAMEDMIEHVDLRI